MLDVYCRKVKINNEKNVAFKDFFNIKGNLRGINAVNCSKIVCVLLQLLKKV